MQTYAHLCISAFNRLLVSTHTHIGYHSVPSNAYSISLSVVEDNIRLAAATLCLTDTPPYRSLYIMHCFGDSFCYPSTSLSRL